jgi:hypothetical protein
MQYMESPLMKSSVGSPPLRESDPPGIVIHDRPAPEPRPLIVAFIWGGKTRPPPTLPFGRWRPIVV